MPKEYDIDFVMDTYYSNAFIRHRRLSSELTWYHWLTYQHMREAATVEENEND